jgi:hypothetical protein
VYHCRIPATAAFISRREQIIPLRAFQKPSSITAATTVTAESMRPATSPGPSLLCLSLEHGWSMIGVEATKVITREAAKMRSVLELGTLADYSDTALPDSLTVYNSAG